MEQTNTGTCNIFNLIGADSVFFLVDPRQKVSAGAEILSRRIRGKLLWSFVFGGIMSALT